IRDFHVTGVQTCALPIYAESCVDVGDGFGGPAGGVCGGLAQAAVDGAAEPVPQAPAGVWEDARGSQVVGGDGGTGDGDDDFGAHGWWSPRVGGGATGGAACGWPGG